MSDRRGRRRQSPGHVRWVMFDYGLVLSDPPSEHDVAALARTAGAPVPAMLEQYWKWRGEYDRADLDGAGYWRLVGAGLGQSYDDATIAELVRLDCQSWLHVRPAMAELVNDLAAAGQPLALLSNAPEEVAAAVAALPIASRFRQLVFSCELQAMKPEPACFALALERLPARPEDVVFIDDREQNVLAAGALGMRSVLYTDARSARESVSRLLAAD